MIPSEFVEFRFELRGADVVTVVDGEEIWRGARPDGPEFAASILSRVIAHYLEGSEGAGATG